MTWLSQWLEKRSDRKQRREEKKTLATYERFIKEMEDCGGPKNVREAMDFDMIKSRLEKLKTG